MASPSMCMQTSERTGCTPVESQRDQPEHDEMCRKRGIHSRVYTENTTNATNEQSGNS
jgi:hypothetical protein